MNQLEQQHIADLCLPGSWQTVGHVLPAMRLPDDAGPALVPQWLAECHVRLQPQAQALLRTLSTQRWSVRPRGDSGLLVYTPTGAWRLQLRQVPGLGIEAIQALAA